MVSLVIVASAVLVLSCGDPHTQADADERFTTATIVDVSKEVNDLTYSLPRSLLRGNIFKLQSSF